MNFAIFGAGCFWCVEAIFSHINGVSNVESGYCNGNSSNPTYEQVCKGKTGHAEVCKISFDPNIVSYNDLLKIFFQIHDPTTLNKQGNDIGTQYRSGIYYIDENQKQLATEYIAKLEKLNIFPNLIVTEVEKLNKFYLAENYHQDYYKRNNNAPYCKLIIKPKLDKFLKD